MGIKAVLVLILFVALGFFLLTTESGKKYITFLQGKLRELTEAVPTITPGEKFIELSVQPEELKDKSFNIANSIFQGYGIYKEVYAEKVLVKKKGEVEVDINIEKGKVTFKDKTIRIFASTARFKLGDFELIPEAPMDVSIEIEPINFTLSNILEESITFDEMSGELKGAKGTVIVLENRSVKIHKFLGEVNYFNRTVSLRGNTTKILINGNDITNIVS